MNTLCFAAGISGGHIIPCLSLAQKITREHPHTRTLFFSGPSSRDAHIVKSINSIHHHIPLFIIGYRRWYHAPLIACSLIGAIITSFYHLVRMRPSRVISTGGIIAVPVCIAAWILRIPIELYELNVVPGAATSFLAPLATTINICFRQTRFKRALNTQICLAPYPIRFAAESKNSPVHETPTLAGFTTTRTTLFIHGGSLGSQFMNTLMPDLITRFPDLAPAIQIIHQTGHDDAVPLAQTWYAQHGIPAHVFSYHDNVADYYRMADLILCRSGAGALFEALFFHKRCITIPLETQSNTHQVENAVAMAYEHPDLFTVVRQNDPDNLKQIYKVLSTQLNRIG